MSSMWQRVASRPRRLIKTGRLSLGADFYEELEESLLAVDIGPRLAESITAGVRQARPGDEAAAAAVLQAELLSALCDHSRELNLQAAPSCILLFGINGAGKTTTIAKLAHSLAAAGKNPLIVAADTFRAAGIEQMQLWAERVGVPCLSGKAGGDPAAAAFDGLKMAAARGHQVVLVDTAGRLQTQANLLQELAKIGRVAGRAIPGAPHESLLVLDGNLGQGSLAQAKGFCSALPITGLVLTKLDGTARGGAVVAIEQELRLPTKLIGVGEGMDDLIPFEPREFVEALVALPTT
ncbi:MAG: signal recognition particle-docking protein FtsY [Candidatus Dormibacteraceae bacterium]